jgi:hypothetical protein
MERTGPIEKNRLALKVILAALVGMAKLGQSAMGSRQLEPASDPDCVTSCLLPTADCRPTLPRHLHRAILRLLRPAESAARRLAIALARYLPPLPPVRPRKPGPPNRTHKASLLVRAGVGTGIVVRRDAPLPAGLAHLAPTKRVSHSFPLLDPLPRWRIQRRWQPATGVPRISLPGASGRTAVAPLRPQSSYDPLDAISLGRRLTALACVLDDLPALSRRFLRWQARRDRAVAADRTHRIAALRGGRPPGGRLSRYDPDALRRQNTREVDEILAHANSLARHALERRFLERSALESPALPRSALIYPVQAPDTS